MVARRVTSFILDDLVSYVDMLGNLSFVTIAGVHHLFDNTRGVFPRVSRNFDLLYSNLFIIFINKMLFCSMY